MSDIIYTPPASSGGGQNPTTNYIPLNNGTSSFVNSSIFNDLGHQILQTELNSTFGLYLIDDGSNVSAYFGDFNYNYNGTSIFLDDTTKFIKTSYNGNFLGLQLDFANNNYSIGDFNILYNGAYIQIDDANRLVNISAGDNFYNTRFIIDDNTQSVYSFNNGNPIGLKLDFVTKKYFLGDFNGLFNSTQIIIDHGGKNITLWADNSLEFKGIGLQSATAGGSSGNHLVIYLNGTQYKIALLNP